MRFVLTIIIFVTATVINGCGAGNEALGQRDDQSVENRSIDDEGSDSANFVSGDDDSGQPSSWSHGTQRVRLQNPYRNDYPADFKSLFNALAHQNVIWNGAQVMLSDQIIKSSDFKKVYEFMMPPKGTSAYMQLVPRVSRPLHQGCDKAYMRLVHFVDSTFGTDYIYFVEVAYEDATLKDFDTLIVSNSAPVEKIQSLGFDLKRDEINNANKPQAVALSIASTIAKEAHGCPISGIRVGKMEKWVSIKIHPYVTYEAIPSN